MSRRVKLPGADELFRATQPTAEPDDAPAAALSPVASSVSTTAQAEKTNGSSGRVKHDEKITVYVTADELLDLEHTRLTMRREHGVAVDRGRIVREAINLALESIAHDGADSPLLRRLRES